VQESKRIPLTQGKWAIVDAEDYADLVQFKWTAVKDLKNGNFYAFRRFKDGSKRPKEWMHRRIMQAPRGVEVDHQNGNGLDNRRFNLRLATHLQNMWNRGKDRDNTSGFKGVTWARNQRRYQAQTYAQGKHILLGYFKNSEDAARAYDKWAFQHHGAFAYLNFPLDA
jgi:hypothetical protein